MKTEAVSRVASPRSEVAPAPRRTQSERSEDTRRRILDASVDLLATRGYAGFSAAEVAQVAGVSRGAQTHHFPSKDDLVVAVVEHVFRRASDLGRKRAHRYASVDEALKALVADAQEFFFSELFLIALDLAIQNRMRSAAGAVVEISMSTRLPVEESWRAALVASGIPEPVAEDLLWLTLSIVRGLAVRRLWQQDATRFQRMFRLWRSMVQAYLDSLAPQRRGRKPLRA
jgi:AcrR family transcriptional regulator